MVIAAIALAAAVMAVAVIFLLGRSEPEAPAPEAKPDPRAELLTGLDDPEVTEADKALAIYDFCNQQPDNCLVWYSPDPPDPDAFDLYPDQLERQRYHCQGQEVIEEFELTVESDTVTNVFCGSQAAYERWQQIKPLLVAKGSWTLDRAELVEHRVSQIFAQADTIYYFVP